MMVLATRTGTTEDAMRRECSRYLLAIGFVVCLVVTACPGGDAPASQQMPAARSACEAVGACEGSKGQKDCETVFALAVPPAGCLDAVESASCEDHASETPSYEDTCFPTCEKSLRTCNGDGTITACAQFMGVFRQITADCGAVCDTKGFYFTGVCGPDYNGQTSDKGTVCWCDAGDGVVGFAAVQDDTAVPPDDPVDDPTLHAHPCGTLCDAASALQCEGFDVTQCFDECLATHESCLVPLVALDDCARDLPFETDWECVGGDATTRPGHCDTERAALDECL